MIVKKVEIGFVILVESDKCKIPKFSLINSSITPYIVIVA